MILSAVLQPNKAAGHRPLRSGHRLDKAGKTSRCTGSHTVAEDRLRHLLEPFEPRPAAGEHDSCTRHAIQTLAHQHLVDTDKEVSRALVEDFGGKGRGMYLIAITTQGRHLERLIFETIAFEEFHEVASMKTAREKGLIRSEGKEYEVRDGDILLFRTSA